MFSKVLQILLLASVASGAAADSPYLAGIHWYSSNTASTDVEAFTGGRAAYVVDQALVNTSATVAAGNPWETPWQTSPNVDKSVPFYKPGYIGAIAAKSHTPIIRLQPQWGVSVPYALDPYTNANFADDCKAAANLMQDVHIWQIGNEANLAGEMNRWDSNTQSYSIPWSSRMLESAPELYAETYLACRDKIHEVSPSTTPSNQIVLMQPCSPGAAAGDRYMSSDEFLARMIHAVPDKSKIDGFAPHAYADPGTADFGAVGFMDQLRRQLAIIDQFGLGDRPIYITEFNRHMPNAQEAANAAKFIPHAFSAMDNWNKNVTTMWPFPTNHSFAAAAWFVYRGDGGWTDYSLEHWKTQVASTSPTDNPWYAYQQASAQGYPSTKSAGPGLTADNRWWRELFSGTAVDTSWPLPLWQEVQPAGTQFQHTGQALAMKSTSAFALPGLHQSQTPYTNCAIQYDFILTDAAPVVAGECNFEVRFFQQVQGGPGLSLTFFPSSSGSNAGKIALRRTSTWETYRSVTVPGGIQTGEAFRVLVWLRPRFVEVKVTRKSDGVVVADWTGDGAFIGNEFHVGGIGMWSYNLREVQLDEVVMGGLNSFVESVVGEWSLY